MVDDWLVNITLGIGVNAAVTGCHCHWQPMAESSSSLSMVEIDMNGLSLWLSSDTRRTVENRNGLSIYATFPSHFSSGLCGEDVQLAGGVVVAVAITVTEITATAAIMTRGALA
ncbi:hypothetical protein JG687_00011549 [Phytophthora cactorum]|uniref:Uncharacterized protein n=1 Tax=Phytophthora cactorum TaxID=29920 RepID=A0A8T1U4B4_9STRA|nr:hypothetical protein JG687_00011549 [Phytophthora cactorum]